MSVLVVDVGTSGLRVLVVRPDGTTEHEHHVETLPSSPQPGLVEFEPATMADTALGLAERVRSLAGPVEAVAIANQRASTVAWDARTGAPIGPGIGWQDLRTVGRCLELRADDVRVAPNQSATKAEWLVHHAIDEGIDLAHLRLGTVDAWLAWHLTGGEAHVTDAGNALVTGLFDAVAGHWDHALLERLSIPPHTLPSVVDTAGAVATTAIDRAPLAALVGDQQASLAGQGCIEPGAAKITFGTGAMLDLCLGDAPGPTPSAGTFPLIAWQVAGHRTWGREAIDLAAGTSVEWLRDGLGLIDSVAASSEVAARVAHSDGVVFVPSLSGTGTPEWDHGARGLLVGLTRGTERAHVVRAVLEGVAHRGADLVDATEADAAQPVGTLRIDGGMSRNLVFVQALADLTGHAVEVSAQREATAVGAGFLAGVAIRLWPDLAAAVGSRAAGTVVEPTIGDDERRSARARFADARGRAGGWIPELSGLDL